MEGDGSERGGGHASSPTERPVDPGLAGDAGGAPGEPPKPCVVVHTNDHQLVAATVAAYALKARSAHPERFDVHILRLEHTPELLKRDGQGHFWWDEPLRTTWRVTNVHSFFPLRRMVPQMLGYRGRALVIDPDIVAVGDVNELLFSDMDGKAILSRDRPEKYHDQTLRHSSVMLLDCAKLTAWDWDAEIEGLFSGRLRLGPLLGLADVPPCDIGPIEEEWNSLDILNDRTKLLHMTKMETQPWRTGLRVDHNLNLPRLPRPLAWLMLEAKRIRSHGAIAPVVHRRHPDPSQELLFLSTLRSGLEQGEITEQLLRWAIRHRYVRRDLLEALDKVGSESHSSTARVVPGMARPRVRSGRSND